MSEDFPDHLCERCGDPMDAEEVNVEAFELSGNIVCAGCADEIFEAEIL